MIKKISKIGLLSMGTFGLSYYNIDKLPES